MKASKRSPCLATDIDSEPSLLTDDGRLLALLETRLCERVPAYEVEREGHLQYAARVHSLRHVFGFVILNGENGRTSEGRKKTWFALVGRLTQSQLVTLEDLCRTKRMRYDAAIVQVFPQAAAYLTRRDRDKSKHIRSYPTSDRPSFQERQTSPTETGSLFGDLSPDRSYAE